MKRTKKGFTIVELVIVIGVIAILSAILIPTFVNLTSKAEDARAVAEVADTYTAYVIEKGASAKTQDKVHITRSEQCWEYSATDGWTKADDYSSHTGEAAYTVNNMKVYEIA